MRFAPYVRISSLICCGTVRQIAASPNSVTVPTIEATTAMMARDGGEYRPEQHAI